MEMVGQGFPRRPERAGGNGLRLKQTCEECTAAKVKCVGYPKCERCNKRGFNCVFRTQLKRGRRSQSRNGNEPAERNEQNEEAVENRNPPQLVPERTLPLPVQPAMPRFFPMQQSTLPQAQFGRQLFNTTLHQQNRGNPGMTNQPMQPQQSQTFSSSGHGLHNMWLVQQPQQRFASNPRPQHLMQQPGLLQQQTRSQQYMAQQANAQLAQQHPQQLIPQQTQHLRNQQAQPMRNQPQTLRIEQSAQGTFQAHQQIPRFPTHSQQNTNTALGNNTTNPLVVGMRTQPQVPKQSLPSAVTNYISGGTPAAAEKQKRTGDGKYSTSNPMGSMASLNEHQRKMMDTVYLFYNESMHDAQEDASTREKVTRPLCIKVMKFFLRFGYRDDARELKAWFESWHKAKFDSNSIILSNDLPKVTKLSIEETADTSVEIMFLKAIGTSPVWTIGLPALLLSRCVDQDLKSYLRIEANHSFNTQFVLEDDFSADPLLPWGGDVLCSLFLSNDDVIQYICAAEAKANVCSGDFLTTLVTTCKWRKGGEQKTLVRCAHWRNAREEFEVVLTFKALETIASAKKRRADSSNKSKGPKISRRKGRHK